MTFIENKIERLPTLVCGVGINDADYPVMRTQRIGTKENGKRRQKVLWTCPFYARWKNMLDRSYSTKFKARNPTYEGVFVCEEWLLFSKFKAWMELQDWEGKHLDKDILISGNKIYSPDTCVFVSAKINLFLLQRQHDRGDLLLGVYWYPRRNQFKAQIKGDVKQHLGYFDTEYEAHVAWHDAKLNLANILIINEGLTGNLASAILERVMEMKEDCK
jgi:hypothetical protein